MSLIVILYPSLLLDMRNPHRMVNTDGQLQTQKRHMDIMDALPPMGFSAASGKKYGPSPTEPKPAHGSMATLQPTHLMRRDGGMANAMKNMHNYVHLDQPRCTLKRSPVRFKLSGHVFSLPGTAKGWYLAVIAEVPDPALCRQLCLWAGLEAGGSHSKNRRCSSSLAVSTNKKGLYIKITIGRNTSTYWAYSYNIIYKCISDYLCILKNTYITHNLLYY